MSGPYFERDTSIIEPKLNALQLAYLLRTIVFARRLSNIPGDEILEKNELNMRDFFSQKGAPIVIRAFNEMDDLPKLLYALSRSTKPVNPIIIDNGSTDGTSDVAKTLHLPAVEEQNRGVVPASIAAFGYIKQHELFSRQVLFLDADCIPGPKWADSMGRLADRFVNGGIAYGLYCYYGGQLASDTLLSSAYFCKNLVSYVYRRKVTAHGGNSAISFDEDGKILNACLNLDTQYKIGLGGLIRDRIKSAGGVAVRTYSPDTIVPTRSDRMPSLGSVIKLFLLPRQQIRTQYADWLTGDGYQDYNGYI